MCEIIEWDSKLLNLKLLQLSELFHNTTAISHVSHVMIKQVILCCSCDVYILRSLITPNGFLVV